MIELNVQIVGADRVKAVLGNLSASLRRRLSKCVSALGIELQGRVIEELTNDVLHVRSNRLRASITQQVFEDGDTIRSTIGTNVPYGGFWERGFERKTGAGARSALPSMRGGTLRKYIASHPPGEKTFDPRPFLRPALDERRDYIRMRIQQALGQELT